LHQRRAHLQPGAGRLRWQGRFGARRRSGHHRPGRRAVRCVRRERRAQQRRAASAFGFMCLLPQSDPPQVHEQHTEVLQRRGTAGPGIYLAEPQMHINGESF